MSFMTLHPRVYIRPQQRILTSWSSQYHAPQDLPIQARADKLNYAEYLTFWLIHWNLTSIVHALFLPFE
jgi:hypothetical protein